MTILSKITKVATITKWLLFSVVVISLGGCGAIVHSQIVSKLPTYEEAQQKWPPIPDGYARLILYWPRLPAEGFGMGGLDTLGIAIDKLRKTKIIDGTFIYVDLPSGTHNIEINPSGGICSRKASDVEVGDGQQVFVALENTITCAEPPRIVDIEFAKTALKEIKFAPLATAEIQGKKK